MTVKHEPAQTCNVDKERKEELMRQIAKIKTGFEDSPEAREVVELLIKKSTEVLHITDLEWESL